MIAVETGRPEPAEYHSAFESYVARVQETEILPALEKQIQEVSAAFSKFSGLQEQYRYAENKWCVREMLGHIIDAERIMGYRGLCIARGETASLPGFDENSYAANSTVDDTPLKDLLQEFEYVRRSHLMLFRNLSRDALLRLGTANQAPLTSRAVAFVMVGHIRHHLHVLSERYAPGLQP